MMITCMLIYLETILLPSIDTVLVLWVRLRLLMRELRQWAGSLYF